MKSSASKIQMTGFDDLFQTGGPVEPGPNQPQEIPLADLYPFKGHPFQVRDDDAMQKMAESIAECAHHGFFGKAPPPGCRSGQREVQFSEQFIVERSGTLGCEQRYILNNFLSADSGQPLSGWCFLKSILPK